jgi:hypothetical protein
MLRNHLLALAAAATFAVAGAAQNCSDNVYPLHLVTANGTPLPTSFDALLNQVSSTTNDENVYAAFDPTMPSGIYYVHLTDNPVDGINDQVLSTNDPTDRFVSITNNGGVISLALAYSSTPVVFGLGLNGVGQSLPLFPFTKPAVIQCRFKAWVGNSWDMSQGPNNPYMILGGLHPTLGGCAIRSYSNFRIGDGNGSDVSGLVFHDLDRDGVRDAGEPGLGAWEVRLVTATTAESALTNGSGNYLFDDVEAGPYTVELTLQSGWLATNAATHSIQVCACGNVQVADFGVAQELTPANARTIGYWRNKHGLELIQQYSILPTLSALNIVNQAGAYVSFGTPTQYKNWLQSANATNMAYMLSAQLVGMHCNVTVGYVSAQSLINDPNFGIVPIGQIMQMAVASLAQHPLTLSGHPQRAYQDRLKTALDNANNNLNWY